MYVKNPDAFRDFDLHNAREFVQYWRRFYRERVTIFGDVKRISYFAEIDPTRPLTAENVRRLLRWKDPKFLTHLIVSGPNAQTLNPKVQRVTKGLSRINAFRSDAIDESTYLDWATSMFPSRDAWVWRLFLVHLARPLEYPIVDQHVLRAYKCHTRDDSALNWSTYARYREYVDKIVHGCIVSNESLLVRRKQTDDALFAFGQFLKRYWSE
jgi:hypothetical protein